MSRDPIVRVAHRGASALYPENTRLVFRQAVEPGVDALEVDIHRILMLGMGGIMTNRPDVLNKVLYETVL